VDGKITTLEVQKRNPDRVSVYLDGRFAFGLPAIVAARLARGQFLSNAEVAELQEEGAAEEAYNRALHFLSFRPRSRAEIEGYLEKRSVNAPQIEKIVARLERAGLLDDEAFAQYWVENRERFRPRGLRALRFELRNKGIRDDTIERALASVNVLDSAYRSAGRKARQLRNTDRQTFFRKLVEYLARRGFSYDVARETAERLWTETVSEG
jgi:regulatory protein